MKQSTLNDLLKATDLIAEAYVLLENHFDEQVQSDADYSYFYNEKMHDLQEIHDCLIGVREDMEAKAKVKEANKVQLQGYFRQCQLDFIKSVIDDPLLKLELMHVIDEKTLRHNYYIKSNVYLSSNGESAYLNKLDHYSMSITKHQFRQTEIELSKALNEQIKHIGFSNSSSYIRFIYGVKKSN